MILELKGYFILIHFITEWIYVFKKIGTWNLTEYHKNHEASFLFVWVFFVLFLFILFYFLFIYLFLFFLDIFIFLSQHTEMYFYSCFYYDENIFYQLDQFEIFLLWTSRYVLYRDLTASLLA